MHENETVLITGGAGSLGALLVREVLAEGARTVRVLDSDEHGLFLLRRSLTDRLDAKRLRLLLGDVRDYGRVRLAIQNVDMVYHAAALKNLEVTEYNPIETCKTNVGGTATLIEAALEARPAKFLFVSSDKSIHNSSLYGATKFVGERMAIWANTVSDHTIFSVVRPPNFITSRGNVFEVWDRQQKMGEPLTLTDPDMRRYFIETAEMARQLVHVARVMRGGEIYIPKTGVREMRMGSLLKKRFQSERVTLIGRRDGEKMREALYTEDESTFVKEEDGLLVIRH